MHEVHPKVSVTPARLDWRVTPLPEQVILVTTADGDGVPHVAAKSRVAVISYGPPTVVVFGCRAEYRTAANVRATAEFVLNVPGDDLVATSWVIGLDPAGTGIDRFDRNGLTRIDGLAVRPPRIAECRAHVECRVLETRAFGPDVAVFGEVLAVSLDGHLVQEDRSLAYRDLAPFFFLDMGFTAALGEARPVDEPVPGPRHDVTILASDDVRALSGFYMRAFDWPLEIESREYVQLALPGGRAIAVCSFDAFEDYTGSRVPHKTDENLTGIQLYLRTDDPKGVIARVIEAGGRPLSGLCRRKWGDEAAYLADPDGNTIAIARRLRPMDRIERDV
jgi:flavin reductase (DIM6/NTAB) family NADH-FMN oxidoreductase RutF/predicted enzyme related to lactoylglutathione lyase